MNICYCTDGNTEFCKMMYNSIRTLLDNNYDCDVYIITNNYKIVSQKFPMFHIIELNEDFFALIRNPRRYGNYFRLWIPLLDEFKSMDRVLYIDSDTEIYGDLHDLYNNQDLNNYDCMCCLDRCVDNKQVLVDYSVNEKFSVKNSLYFNTGVILFNIKNITKYYNRDFLLNIMKINKKKTFPLFDQGILNSFVNIGEFDLKYNSYIKDDDAIIYHPYGKSKYNSAEYLNRIGSIKI